MLHYEVKWAGGAITWEPTWNLTNCQQLVDAFETEWRRQYDEGPAPRPKPRAKPAAAEAEEVADSEAEAVADNNAAPANGKKRKWIKRSHVWDAFIDLGQGISTSL